MIIAKSAGRVLHIWVSYREVEQLQHPRITIIVLPAASGSKDILIEPELGWSQYMFIAWMFGTKFNSQSRYKI